MYQQQLTTPGTAVRKSTDPLPKWKSYEPNSPAWIRQAMKRYSLHDEKLEELAELAEENPFICYECYRDAHLADYYVRNDRTETFRYCSRCARSVREHGAAVTKLQDIVEPETSPNETIELPVVEASTKKGFHPLFYVGGTVLFCVLLYWLITAGLPSVAAAWSAAHTSNPPISELSIVVAGKPYLAVAQNLNGQVIVVVEPLDDITHMHEYPVARTSSPDQTPVVSFDGISTLYIRLGDSIFPLNLAAK